MKRKETLKKADARKQFKNAAKSPEGDKRGAVQSEEIRYKNADDIYK